MMKVCEFDIIKGFYKFEMEQIETECHTHPVFEILLAQKGDFELNTGKNKLTKLTFAIVDKNKKHSIATSNAILSVIMCEVNNKILEEYFRTLGVVLLDGVYCSSNKKDELELFAKIELFAKQNNLKAPLDDRVQKCLGIIEKEHLSFNKMIPTLVSKVFLSESRLSHIFKDHIGVSLKSYLVWDKLRKAMNLYLTQGKNFNYAALEVGFFDQAHLSKAFKSLFGVSPSKPYNSRTLQE